MTDFYVTEAITRLRLVIVYSRPTDVKDKLDWLQPQTSNGYQYHGLEAVAKWALPLQLNN